MPKAQRIAVVEGSEETSKEGGTTLMHTAENKAKWKEWDKKGEEKTRGYRQCPKGHFQPTRLPKCERCGHEFVKGGKTSGKGRTAAAADPMQAVRAVLAEVKDFGGADELAETLASLDTINERLKKLGGYEAASQKLAFVRSLEDEFKPKHK